MRAHSAALTLPKDVHIVPMLREVDRALLPFLPKEGPPLLHAHRIHLLVADQDMSRRLAAKVERPLRRVAEVRQTSLGSGAAGGSHLQFQDLLRVFSKLVRQEVRDGNRVHVNLSTGSKLVAFAAGLAAMAHLPPGQGSLYYVRPEGYLVTEAEFEEHGTTKGLVAVEPVQIMPMFMPAPLQLRILAFLAHVGGEAGYRLLLRFLSEVPGSGYGASSDRRAAMRRRWTNTTTTRMVRSILSPLSGLGLVELLDRGRERLARLTPRGAMYASISALGEDDLREPL